MQNDDNEILKKKLLVEINEDFHHADKLNEALEESSILMSLIYACRL